VVVWRVGREGRGEDSLDEHCGVRMSRVLRRARASSRRSELDEFFDELFVSAVAKGAKGLAEFERAHVLTYIAEWIVLLPVRTRGVDGYEPSSVALGEIAGSIRSNLRVHTSAVGVALIQMCLETERMRTRSACIAALDVWAEFYVGPHAGDEEAAAVAELWSTMGDRLKPVTRLRLGLFAGPQHWVQVAERGLDGVSLEEVGRFIDGLLGVEPFELAWPALIVLIERGTWLTQRLVLSRLGPTHTTLLPDLADIAAHRRDDPVVLRDVADALGRMEHVGAEPILSSLLESAHTSVVRASVESLGRLGTRRALGPLSSVRERHPSLSSDVDEATRSIVARDPVDAQAGALSVVDPGGLDGALSVAQPSEGALAIYRDVEARALDTQRALSVRPQTLPMPGLYLLPAGPRRVPVMTRAHQYAFGRRGEVPGAMLLAASIMALLNVMGAPTPVFVVLGCVVVWFLAFALRFAWVRAREVVRALSHGTPTYAQLQYIDEWEGAEGEVTHSYVFTFIDEELVAREHRIDRRRRVRRLEDDALEPALYEEGALVLLDDVTGVTVRDDGTLGATRTVLMISSWVYPLVVGLIWFAFT